MKILLCIVTLLISSLLASAQWVKQTVNTTASFRGLSVVSEKVVWASGSGGTVIKTTDGGANWRMMTVPSAEKLDFRDIEAFDANTAYILSIGNGDSSRIYKTTDGGATWVMQFKNEDKNAFFDAIACWDKANCIAMSDPVDGHYLLISTANGGDKWERIVSNQMAAAIDGEAAFAASGTCLITQGKTNAFIVSGGKDARVFRSTDRGKTWNVARSPIIYGPSGAGIFSIAMWDSFNGVIVGGNYEKPSDAGGTLGFTTDGGATWKAGKGLSGYRSAVTYIASKTILAVGTNGVDITTDGGVTWKVLDTGNYNAVQANTPRSIWAVGPNGAVARFNYMADLTRIPRITF
jgi:photosystem II stability/assembly factor-like uncharacterized protein